MVSGLVAHLVINAAPVLVGAGTGNGVDDRAGEAGVADVVGGELDAQGFKGMEYSPFTKRYWLSQDTSVNYLLACRKG